MTKPFKIQVIVRPAGKPHKPTVSFTLLVWLNKSGLPTTPSGIASEFQEFLIEMTQKGELEIVGNARSRLA